MSRSPHSPSATRSSRAFRRAALGLALWFAASVVGCGATPMPEPPSLYGDHIGPGPMGISTLSEPHQVRVAGAPGAATPGSTLRALNLDLYQGFEETTVDLYSAVRNGYLQRRENLIKSPPPY